MFLLYVLILNRNLLDNFDGSLDDMGGRINELEQSINDLRAEMGVEGTPPPPSKSGDEPKTPADSTWKTNVMILFCYGCICWKTYEIC